ncbi:hypothetical protein [Paenibacillus sp. MBLB4367]|uniref:hypothetical protein n=1 Tax=Paenibacillus sp. MBLB4367 TaxID=3384767 RepID=UPI0039082301
MNPLILAIIAGMIGIAVTGAAFYTIWYLFEQWKKQQASAGEGTARPTVSETAGALLLRWTVLDYAVLLLMAAGMLLLLADVLGVIRDRSSYPDYHYGYLLAGTAFAFLGMLFMLVRLLVVLSVARKPAAPAPNDGHEPNQAHDAE